jgi:hypothetical protein
LLPKVQQYKDQNKLGGIVAIAGCRNQSAKRRKTHLILPANMRGNLLGNRWDVRGATTAPMVITATAPAPS